VSNFIGARTSSKTWRSRTQEELTFIDLSKMPFLWGLIVVCSIFFAIVKSAQWVVKNRIKRKQGAISPSDQSTNVRPLLNFDIASTIPYPYRPWSSGKFAMTMGIQKVEQENRLTLDNRYVHEQSLRRELLAKNREGVMQMLPGSEAACTEMLDLIVSLLTSRYPQLFFRPVGKPDYLHNSLTNRTFKVTAPYEISPLEIAAQLIMEDLNLLIQGFGDDSEQHNL
jgi:hypothetical protein